MGRQSEAMAMAKGCLSGVGAGLWSSTVGQVESIKDVAVGAYNLVTSPLATMSRASEAVRQITSAIGEIYDKGLGFFADIPLPVASEIMCSIGASLGSQALISLLTGGVGLVGLSAKVLKILMSLEILAKLKNIAIRLKLSIEELFKLLDGLPDKARDKFNDLMKTTEGQRRAESMLVSCTVN
jgi:hypothetical protein